MRPLDLPAADRYEHGTRSRYVCGCRCDACRESNNIRHRARTEAMQLAAASAVPNGPPLDGTLLRGGRVHRVKVCPGANGEPCFAGGAWLRNAARLPVCSVCIERATVWNGLVDIETARDHLMKLRRSGVGYKSVAAACDISETVLCDILSRAKPQIRKSTERRILSVDAGARSGGCVLPPASARKVFRQVEELRAIGFTRSEIAGLLGSHSPALQIGRTGRVTARTADAVARLVRRVRAGDVKSSGPLEPAAETNAALEALAARGLTARDLSGLLGFTVNFSQRPAKVRREHADAVRALLADLERRRIEGDGLPDGWQVEGKKLHEAFGLDGEGRPDGWQWERRTSKKKAREEQAELRRLARGRVAA